MNKELDMQQFDAEAYVDKVSTAADYINRVAREKRSDFKPEISLTLGSGLGDLAKQIDAFSVIPYAHIPNFPKLTVTGHEGKLILGFLEGVPIVGLSGRKHFYEVAEEPYGMMQVVFPVHVMASLGIKIYFSTNAVGGLNSSFDIGDLMVIKEHLDLFMPDPLTGPHLDFGENLYFQPQHTEYDKELNALFQKAATSVGEEGHIHEGVYTATTGRTYETAATCRMLRSIGADAVGMSVVPEVIVATNRGMRTIAVSIVTNKVDEDGTNATSHEDVMTILNNSETKSRLTKTFSKFFELYSR